MNSTSLTDPSRPHSNFLRSAWVLLVMLQFLAVAAFAATQDGFVYTTTASAATITGYSGRGGALVIPALLGNKPVTTIGTKAFLQVTSLTSVTIGNAVEMIAESAFAYCTGLTSIKIPSSLTSIGEQAFGACTGLKSVYFAGNRPIVDGADVFFGTIGMTVFYLPGKVGWGSTFAERPARLWNPTIKTSDPAFGVALDGFGFTITGTANIPVTVEGSADLSNTNWVPLLTGTLTGGSLAFKDPDWVNHPARFYRIQSPWR